MDEQEHQSKLNLQFDALKFVGSQCKLMQIGGQTLGNSKFVGEYMLVRPAA